MASSNGSGAVQFISDPKVSSVEGFKAGSPERHTSSGYRAGHPLRYFGAGNKRVQ